MGVDHLPRVVVVCLLAGLHAAARAEDGAPTPAETVDSRAATSTSTPASTPTATLPPRAATATANVTSLAGTASGSAAPRNGQRPPPAVIFVPMLGAVGIPLVLPTTIPNARQEGPARKEQQP